MIITNSSVNSVAAIRDGVEFYYFGLGCIADYYGNSIAYLDELDIEIILLCGGTKTLIEIIDCVETRTNCNRDDILNKLNKLLGNCETSSKSFEPDLQEVDVDNKSFKT
jgi:hypothetical protein